MSIPIKGQPELVLKQTSHIKVGQETPSASQVSQVEKKSIGSFLSNCVDKLANCFTSSNRTDTVSSFQEPTAMGEIQGQVAFNPEHLSAEKVADAVKILSPMKLENTQGEDLKQVIETNLDGLKTLKEEGVNTDNEIQLLNDIKLSLEQNKVDDVMSGQNYIKMDTANSEISEFNRLSNTESNQIYEFMGINVTWLIHSSKITRYPRYVVNTVGCSHCYSGIVIKFKSRSGT